MGGKNVGSEDARKMWRAGKALRLKATNTFVRKTVKTFEHC